MTEMFVAYIIASHDKPCTLMGLSGGQWSIVIFTAAVVGYSVLALWLSKQK